MKKEIAEKWIAELRSGKWKQGKGYLCDGVRHCCLGVLCEIAITDGVKIQHYQTDEYSPVEFGGSDIVLPDKVQEWADIKDEEGGFGGEKSLADLNDSGVSFSEIADIIEANIDNL